MLVAGADAVLRIIEVPVCEQQSRGTHGQHESGGGWNASTAWMTLSRLLFLTDLSGNLELIALFNW